eukprot:TRINITY_DN7430_c0_g1_i1.p1 TRINITY_DN7430_c0_g1~~TRINITY_DN7430_c0_g1_i1.p1  ORF type:complete len:267 (+),score=30.06 TRINITY_DN7430_c0_g1_i1:103-903(+)
MADERRRHANHVRCGSATLRLVCATSVLTIAAAFGTLIGWSQGGQVFFMSTLAFSLIQPLSIVVGVGKGDRRIDNYSLSTANAVLVTTLAIWGAPWAQSASDLVSAPPYNYGETGYLCASIVSAFIVVDLATFAIWPEVATWVYLSHHVLVVVASFNVLYLPVAPRLCALVGVCELSTIPLNVRSVAKLRGDEAPTAELLFVIGFAIRWLASAMVCWASLTGSLEGYRHVVVVTVSVLFFMLQTFWGVKVAQGIGRKVLGGKSCRR